MFEQEISHAHPGKNADRKITASLKSRVNKFIIVCIEKDNTVSVFFIGIAESAHTVLQTVSS